MLNTFFTNKNSVSFIARLFTKLGDIYTWQDASKACFIALGTSLAPIFFGLWFGIHYLQLQNTGISYIALTDQQLLSAIQYCVVLSVYMFLVSVLATWCVLQNKFSKSILYFTLVSVSVSQSILFAMLGLFDGISWLILLIYSTTGLVFLNRLQVMFTITLMVLFMALWSVLYNFVPFDVRAYQFTNAISLSSMSALDLFITWLAVISTSTFCSVILDILMGAWRYREKDLHSKSFQDELTSLLNRRAIQDGLKEEFFRAKRGEYSLSVAMLDLDHFKIVNDSYGHPFGDKVLKLVSAKMLEVTRKKDLVGRYGGEEFLIVFPECEDTQAKKILERLRENMEAQILTTDHGADVRVTLSAGISTLKMSDKIEDLVRRADQSLYEAKATGRNKVLHG